MTTELKPGSCPWCRSDAEIIALSNRVLVQCSKGSCGASGPFGRTRAAAIKEWNKVAEVISGN